MLSSSDSLWDEFERHSEAQRQRLTAALKKLKPKATAHEIREHVRRIREVNSDALLNEHPDFGPRSDQRAREELPKVALLALALANAFDALPPKTKQALATALPCEWFDTRLRTFAYAVWDAGKAIKLTPGRQRGRPASQRASAVTDAAREAYTALTGKTDKYTVDPYMDSPRAAGPFYQFLREIFDAIGLHASPEHRIKKLRK